MLRCEGIGKVFARVIQAMRRALLSCLLVLLTACSSASTSAVPVATIVVPGATATATRTVMAASNGSDHRATATVVPSAGSPCPEGMPVKGVVGGDGQQRALVPGDPEYDTAVWAGCYATVSAAAVAGFARTDEHG
jgi:hypothetical protein